MKKILLDAYIDLNFGDDLFLKILFERYKEVKWILPQGGKKYKTIFKEYNNVEIKDNYIYKIIRKMGLNEKNRMFNRYDAGVYIGGSIFMQIPIWNEQLSQRKNIIKSFLKENKPYFIMGSNFGPFTDKRFLNEYIQVFQKCRDVCFRDKYSYKLFKELDNVRIAPDIVFQLKPKNIKKINDSIGISVIELKNRKELNKYRKNYLQQIVQIIRIGIQQRKNFTLFSFCESQGDLEICNNIMGLLNENEKENVRIVNYTGNIDQFLVAFESMENIIGTRFHACILSQVFGQGLYPLIYSDKTYNVLSDIGLDKEYIYIKDIENLDINHVLKVISNNKISDKKIFKEAEKQFEGLDRYVSGE